MLLTAHFFWFILFAMVLAKLSNEIVSMRGRFGGVYFKTGPDGQHIQAMPRNVNYTRSLSQQGHGNFFDEVGASGIKGYSGSVGLWLAAFVAAFASLWAIFATMYYFHEKGKDPKKISGYNWYIHYALMFPEAERPPFWKPPHAPGKLPEYIVAYRGPWMYQHTPTEQPDYSPGEYYWEGVEFNGRPSYHTDDGRWYLWWRGDVWVLSLGFDYEDPPTTFYSTGTSRRGRYRNDFHNTWAHVYWGYKR